jgi:FKBP-type peptidyl-prolyl cis-trans isomerase
MITLLALAVPAMLQAQEPMTADEDVTAAETGVAVAETEEAAAEPSTNYSPEEILEAWGWFLAQQIDLAGLALNEDEIRALSVGMLAASQGEQPKADLEQIAPFVQEYLTARSESILAERSLVGESEASNYFEELDANPDIIKLASGLRYQVIEPGSGAYPSPEDVVVVHYTGKLLDGTVFDSSVARGEPASFQLNQVIPGWTQGLQKVSAGGTIQLHIPADQAYGDAGRPGIPPASALFFEVELLEVKPAIPPAEPAPGLP